MNVEDELHEELLSLHRRTGQATGYWPNYFLRSVRNQGGLQVARKLLAPSGKVTTGFETLVQARRADLLVEHIVLEPRFEDLFTGEELKEARRRLEALPPEAFPESVSPGEIEPAEVDANQEYLEGAVRQVTINNYERRARARKVCIDHYGHSCSVCGFDFEERYGEIGKEFIHVHHKRPLSELKSSYRLDPKKDLVPVCPNCHAMLHRRKPPLDVEQLRALLRRT